MAEDRYDCVMQYCAVQLFVFPLCLSFVQGQVSGWCWCVLQHRSARFSFFSDGGPKNEPGFSG